MADDMLETKLRGRLLKVPIDGLDLLELANIVGQVEQRIINIEERTELVDGSKLAMLAAIEFAVELHNLKKQYGINVDVPERKIRKLEDHL